MHYGGMKKGLGLGHERRTGDQKREHKDRTGTCLDELVKLGDVFEFGIAVEQQRRVVGIRETLLV